MNMIANEYENLRMYMDKTMESQKNIDIIDGVANIVDKYTTLLQNYGRKKDDWWFN